MAKNTAQDIIDLGLIPSMFAKKDEGELTDLIDSVIDEQSAIFQGRIGSTAYASATSPTKEYVKRAEKCLIAAEMIQRRINIILGNAVGAGQEIDISQEIKQRELYLDEFDGYTDKIVSGVTSASSDLETGVLITSHFETT
jgi:hypothetical protein